jgi:hypothetical protein
MLQTGALSRMEAPPIRAPLRHSRAVSKPRGGRLEAFWAAVESATLAPERRTRERG